MSTMQEVVRSFLEYDGDKRDAQWASEKCRIIHANSIQVQTKEDYDKSEEVLFGKFPEANLKKIFSHSTMQPYYENLSKDSSVYLFESVRNAMIDERTQADLRCFVDSYDPEKEEKKSFDRKLLKNRKAIESLTNEITGNNGMPPVKFKGEDFNGNVDEFDESGGDDLDDDSIETFLETQWGLRQEIELQKPLDAVIRVNNVVGDYDKYMNDIFIKNHTLSQAYVDDTTGQIKIEHLFPWEVWTLNATGSNDYKDSQAIRVSKQTNVRGFLKLFGSHFDFHKNWSALVSAGNTESISLSGIRTVTNPIKGITHNRELVAGEGTGKTVELKTILDLPISYEYCEWKAITKVRKQYLVSPAGNIIPTVINDDNPAVDGAAVEEKTTEDTYRAYYLRDGQEAAGPKIIKWGKLYMQNIEGFNDEYSGFSIIITKRDGTPMVDIIKPFHSLMNVCFKMFEMLINDIKPDGWFFNVDSLVKIAAAVKQSKDTPDDVKIGIDDILKMAQQSINGLTSNPETAAGDPLGGGNMSIMPKKNGLNAAAAELMKIMEWIEIKVKRYTSTDGITPTGNSDGFKLSLENKKRTRQNTAFIDFIMLNHLQSISICILNYAKDISKFKDIPAYKFLENLVGSKCMKFIGSMKKAPHRYGTFIDTFNNDIELLEMKQLAMMEYQKGTLPFEDVLAVRSMKSIKGALAYLAKARRKAEKQKRMDQMGILKQQDQNAENAFQRQLKLEDKKGEWLTKARGEEALGFSNAASLAAKARIAAETLKQDGQNQRLADKATNEIDNTNNEFNQRQQEAAKV